MNFYTHLSEAYRKWYKSNSLQRFGQYWLSHYDVNRKWAELYYEKDPDKAYRMIAEDHYERKEKD